MQRFYINLTPQLSEEIERKARVAKKTKAEVTREALKIGLEKIQLPKSQSAQALLDFVKQSEKIPTQGKVPADAIENMDFYTWGGKKRE